MKTRLLMIIGLSLTAMIIPNVSAMCAAETLEWWEPCNDTGPFSDGIYIKYHILVPTLTVIILIIGITLLMYWRKRK